ncbi:PaaI family thioesterase [Roseomonas sp. NAR14]|uniref:PaaI family thioesterase n=1 Tax=Roseomonas acroporae TaxID=2937791 RepID=A0A9X2BTV6_9PROT|nr:PaaI family thioesterase [Roseomonas acroporae]MCK8785038.1 PaaI family thioesterase [Roseomonas acroporae]
MNDATPPAPAPVPAPTSQDDEFAAVSAPYHDLLGMRLVHWEDGFARVTCEAGPQHANRSGITHGGVCLSLIDQTAAYSGLWCSVPGNVRRAVTIDLDCRFTGQVLGGRLTAESRIVTRGRNIFFCRTEVFGPDGTMVAFGASTHRWRRGSETVEGVPADSKVF